MARTKSGEITKHVNRRVIKGRAKKGKFHGVVKACKHWSTLTYAVWECEVDGAEYTGDFLDVGTEEVTIPAQKVPAEREALMQKFFFDNSIISENLKVDLELESDGKVRDASSLFFSAGVMDGILKYNIELPEQASEGKNLTLDLDVQIVLHFERDPNYKKGKLESLYSAFRQFGPVTLRTVRKNLTVSLGKKNNWQSAGREKISGIKVIEREILEMMILKDYELKYYITGVREQWFGKFHSRLCKRTCGIQQFFIIEAEFF